AYFEVNQRTGRRWNAASAFLHPIAGRANLTVITGARAERIVFSGRRATGVVYVADGTQHTARARRELILSGGSIGSAQLLQVSGVGPGARLHTLGIPVVHDLPGVGENLQDHLQLRSIYRVQGAR